MSMQQDDRRRSRTSGACKTLGESDGPTGSVLNSVVGRDILPRLKDAFAVQVAQNAGQLVWEAPIYPIGQSDVDALYNAVLGRSRIDPQEVLADVTSRGVQHRHLREGLLAPVAVRLGDGWLKDECSFFDVTVGMSKLHQALHDGMVSLQCARNAGNGLGRTILLAGAPNEQHLFGLGLIEQAFMEADWRVLMLAGADWTEVCETLGNEPCDVLGVTCAGDRLQPGLKSAIDEARLVSANPDMKVIVGGHLFLKCSSLVRDVGADAGASDSRSAVETATSLVKAIGELADDVCLTSNSLA